MPFRNKVVAITGAASGIGLALAHHLLSLGAKISIADINRVALHHAVLELEAKHPGTAARVHPTELDIRNVSAVNAWIAAVVSKFGRIDGAANLAGVAGDPPYGYLTRDTKDDDWDRIIAINVTGLKNCIKAELGVMKEGASVVNAASIAGIKATPRGSAYAVSKAGVIALTKCAAREEGSRGIRINAVAPGFVDTPMLDALEISIGEERVQTISATAPLARKGRSDEVAKAIAFLLSDDSSFITGSVQVVDGGFSI